MDLSNFLNVNGIYPVSSKFKGCIILFSELPKFSNLHRILGNEDVIKTMTKSHNNKSKKRSVGSRSTGAATAVATPANQNESLLNGLEEMDPDSEAMTEEERVMLEGLKAMMNENKKLEIRSRRSKGSSQA